jgi:peptide chain release factor subunit 3
MSNLDSWEQDEDAQQPQQNSNNQFRGNAGAFNPNSTFTPGAQSFQPGQQYGGYNQFQQYGGGYNQGGYGQGGYPQYGGGQQGYSQGGYPQYGQQGGYGNQQYGGYAPQQAYQHPNAGNQPRAQAPISIAKRPDANAQSASQAAPVAAAPKPAAPSADAIAGKVKTLSIAADPPKPKVESTGGTKTLSIGVPAPPKEEKAPKTADAGAKATAAKAIEKTGEATPKGKTSPAPASGRDSPSASSGPTKAVDANAVQIEMESAANAEILKEMDLKEHVNVIFLGHVDAGKSTLGGSILVTTGMIDERTLDKYKRDAKDAGRETWYLSWALDLTKEERSKGKTVEVGRGFFETDRRRYSILDAPGHKTFVPNMLGGAAQADVGVLVISARKGEFETGFERGGQTREHAMLAKTQGVNKLIVVINKMDDPTVNWEKSRYDECKLIIHC